MATLPTNPSSPKFRWKRTYVIPGVPTAPGFLCIPQDQMDEVNTDAYTCPAWSPADGHDQVPPMIFNSPTHHLGNPFRFTFDDSEASHIFHSPYYS